jgi:hypothetical protein
MPYLLRSITIGDVIRALKRRKPRLALCLVRCLISNAVNAVRFHVRRGLLCYAARRTS